MGLFALTAAALAGLPTVESGWASFRAGDHEGAERVAAERLAADPTDLGAGRLHLRARSRLDGDAAAIAEARTAMEVAPDQVAHRLLLADTLVEAWRFDPAWCAEIHELLGATPQGDLRFWAHALRWRASTRRCRTDTASPDAERADALALWRADLSGADAVFVNLAVSDGLDASEANRLGALLDAEPALLGRFDVLWEQPLTAPVKRLRRSVLARAVRAADAGSLAELSDAAAVLRAADDPALARAEEALAAIHPDPHGFGLSREIAVARRHADAARALAQVDALGERIRSANAPARTDWHMARGDLLWELGRAADAVDAYREAWRATPTDGDVANAFAYRAAMVGGDVPLLEDALQAASTAVDAARARRFVDRPWAGESWNAWRERTASEVGGALDTRGWVLHALGRDELAAPDLLQAARTVDVPVVHLHAGLVLAALGDGDAAAPHLARGVAERDPREAPTVHAGWAALEAWWGASGRWHARGVRGWVADLERTEVPLPTVRNVNALVGQSLPASARVRMGGRDVGLADIEGPVVFDFWATWCRPCVESLPKMEQLAEAQPGVRFVAVSVDSDPALVDAFFEGSPPSGYDVAWWSAEANPYDTLGMTGVPSLFVVGSDRRVASYLLGSDVNRLGEAVEAVLGGAD